MAPELRVLLVDDEAPARREMRALLSALGESIRVTDAADLDQAERAARETAPHVVFLDIQLRGESGLDLVNRLPAGTRVVFVTAHDRYAIQAFELNALDYLLKPVERARLAATVARTRSALASAGNGRDEPPLFLGFENAPSFVRPSEIRCIRANGDYTWLERADGRHLCSWSLARWEARLPPTRFIRVHRSALVNLDLVRGVRRGRGRRSLVILAGEPPQQVPISRRRLAELRRGAAGRFLGQ